MKMRFIEWAICWALTAEGLHAAGQQWEEIVKQGDIFAQQHQPRQALGCFQRADAISPQNHSVLERISEQLSDLVDLEKSEPLARECLFYAQQAVKAAPESSRAHIDLAIAYGKLTDFTDNRTKLGFSRMIKSEAEEALRLDSGNALAAHVLGRWHEGIATLNPMLKAMARIIYGGMPPASMQEAIALLKKAVDLDPGCIMYRRELAQALTKAGQHGLAKTQWEEIVRLSATDKKDLTAQQEARSALRIQ